MNRNVTGEGRDVAALDLRIVEIVKVVKNPDLMTVSEQLLDKVRSDKTGAARDENFHRADGKDEAPHEQGANFS
jgi:hypothetical protein